MLRSGHSIKPGTPGHGTTEQGTPTEHRNAGGTPEHWRNNGTLAEQSEFHGMQDYKRKSFIKKLYEKCSLDTSSRPLLFFKESSVKGI